MSSRSSTGSRNLVMSCLLAWMNARRALASAGEPGQLASPRNSAVLELVVEDVRRLAVLDEQALAPKEPLDRVRTRASAPEAGGAERVRADRPALREHEE